MHAPETPPPPLAPLWERVVRARALPPDLDVSLLYRAIRDRLARPEWQVRLHALRVLADLLPLSGNALSFPFDQAVDNLGHPSPNVRKAALDALKVFCAHCEDPECAARAILDKCYYHNITPQSADMDAKMNVITGLILSIPSVMGILKKRNPTLDTFPVYQILGEKLFDPVHRDVAYRAIIKLRKVNGPHDYIQSLSRLDPKIQEKFRFLCENYDEDSLDVYYAPRKTIYRENDNRSLVAYSDVFNNNSYKAPALISTDSSSEDSYGRQPVHNNNFAKVIIETEIKFNSDTAITMTVLEETETESERFTTGSEDEGELSEGTALRLSDGDSEDTDLVVKRVRFGGEIVKIRTPDSDNLLASEDDLARTSGAPHAPGAPPPAPHASDALHTPHREVPQPQPHNKTPKKSGIPLPVIKIKPKVDILPKYNGVKLKSKSLSELYDYFRSKNDSDSNPCECAVPGARSPEKAAAHREVEVLHNLQREPAVSPRSHRPNIVLDKHGFVLNLLASSPPPPEDLVSPRAPPPLEPHYEWEELDIVPPHVVEQLHNTENWIGAVKAADQVHSALLEPAAVARLEPAALSLVTHMFALSDAVGACRAPAEGAVCAVVRACSAGAARALVPALAARLAHDPPPAALPHALLHRLALHHLVQLILDPDVMRGAGADGGGGGSEERSVRAALCVARAAGPAAVLAAVRRRLAGTARADRFCNKLRERVSRPLENIKPTSYQKRSQVPVASRRRARSTPPPAAPPPPRRLRPLPDSAPLFGAHPPSEYMVKPLSPIPLSDRDVSSTPLDSARKHPNRSQTDGCDSTEECDVGRDDDAPDDDVAKGSSSTLRRSHSLRLEDFAESGRASPASADVDETPAPASPLRDAGDSVSQKSSGPESEGGAAGGDEGPAEPAPASPASPAPAPRDVRAELGECTLPARHDDWEAVVVGLARAERLAAEAGARAPAAAWRAAARGAAAHVRSLRSRVARAACRALGALFEYRGRALEPELDEAAAALLERCADVNRFLRADAGEALARVACGVSAARGAAALCRRGATHRAGAVRAAAAAALARLARRGGAARTLSLPAEARAMVLRAAGELLGDASAETRAHARALCCTLAEDARFRPLLKEAMPPSRYRAVEKLLDRLPPCR